MEILDGDRREESRPREISKPQLLSGSHLFTVHGFSLEAASSGASKQTALLHPVSLLRSGVALAAGSHKMILCKYKDHSLGVLKQTYYLPAQRANSFVYIHLPVCPCENSVGANSVASRGPGVNPSTNHQNTQQESYCGLVERRQTVQLIAQRSGCDALS